MAVFVNPKGTPIKHPERFGLEPGAVAIYGTDGDDTFIFNEGPFTGGPQHVIFGLGGSDTFLGPNNVTTDRWYSGYTQDQHHWDLVGDGRAWRPDLDKRGWSHIGPNDESKGIDRVVTHGGHYGEGNEATIWVGTGSATKVYVPGREIYEDDTMRFIKGTVRHDADGKGWTGQLSSVEIHNSTPDNMVTDGQELLLMARDPKTATHWAPTYVDFAHASGPTHAEAQSFIDHWTVLV